MDFSEFKQAVDRRFNELKGLPLFQANVDKGFLWELYLDSFPEGTNPKFRERREHDCCACRSFIKNAGGMVAIVDGQLQTIWDLPAEGEYKAVAEVLADYVRSCKIANVFMHPEANIGIDRNREDFERKVLTWEHLHIAVPPNLRCNKHDRGTKESEYRAQHDVVLRSLQEISMDAIEIVQDLIAQNSLYKGEEKRNLVNAFHLMKTEYDKIKPGPAQDLFAWQQVNGPNAWVCKVRNDVIGTLLVDLSEGKDLEAAVKSFEDKVSGTNYKRPTALVSTKMKEAARQKLIDLDLMAALDRRYARLEDINVQDVLYADRSARKKMGGDVFDDIKVKNTTNPKSLDKVENVTIEKFLTDILPTAESIELLFENQHAGNLVSLIAPYSLTARTMFKWPNAFSWSYTGDVADSIREKVKAAGGNVTGDVCCRLAWYNHDDLDFHMQEPDGNKIYYSRKGPSACGGQLDVDMNAGGRMSRTPVENIFYKSRGKMRNGTYELGVHQFNRRDHKDEGFEVEIDVQGTVHSFAHPKALNQNAYVTVAKLVVTNEGVQVQPVIPSSQSQRELWGLKTQDYHRVSAIMLSPNFWGDKQVGNKHYFFMLDACKNDGSARGFYNEFLCAELEPHRKTMEIVGSKMRAEESENQLSGLGFSSTQRNSVVCRVRGTFNRLLKITF
jgi:hypothetical protein